MAPTLPALPDYWLFVRAIHRWLVDPPHKGPIIGRALMFPLLLAWISCWTHSQSVGETPWSSRNFASMRTDIAANRYSNSMEIPFCSHPCCSEMIAVKFCTWQNCTVLASAKFCSDEIPFIGVTLNLIFHRIRFTMEKSFVKWALGHVLINEHLSYGLGLCCDF